MSRWYDRVLDAIHLVQAFVYLLLGNPVWGSGQPRSPEWRKVRAAHLVEHPTCAACGATKRLNVHHITPYHLRPDLELEPTNLLTLCEGAGNCHLVFGHLKNWSSFNVAAEEDANKYRTKVENRP